MKLFSLGFILTWVAIVNGLKNARQADDLPTEIRNAKARLKLDYLDQLWVQTSEKIADSQYNILKLYSHSTIEQAQQVIEYIATYTNLTRTESSAKRQEALADKSNKTRIDCVINNEINTIKAYKMTGYNLHSCIRMAQIGTETKYLEIVRSFENIKTVAARHYDYYTRSMDNCIDTNCVMATLVQSVVQYEKLQEELRGNVTEVHNLSSRYLMTNIAMGCVANSLTQVFDNYNIGKGLVNYCLVPRNSTKPGAA